MEKKYFFRWKTIFKVAETNVHSFYLKRQMFLGEESSEFCFKSII